MEKISAVATLQNVLRSCQIDCWMTHVRDSVYDVQIRLREGIRHLRLDFSSDFVKSFVSNVYSNFIANHGRCPHFFIATNNKDKKKNYPKTLSIVELSEDAVEDTHDECNPIVELPDSIPQRVIPLPYTSGESQTPKKRRVRTFAQLVGEQDEFTCKHCFQVFKRKYNLERHEASVHCGTVYLRCPACPAVYRHPHHFADHLRTHDNVELSCRCCQQPHKFATRAALRVHEFPRKNPSKRRGPLEGETRRDGKRRSCAYPPTDPQRKSIGHLKKAHDCEEVI